MIQIIVLANLAVIFAFLAGATMDLSPLLAPSDRRAKLFSALATIAMGLLILVVARNSN